MGGDQQVRGAQERRAAGHQEEEEGQDERRGLPQVPPRQALRARPGDPRCGLRDLHQPRRGDLEVEAQGAVPEPQRLLRLHGDFSAATGTVTFIMMLASRFIFKYGWGVAALITP